jgi:L,D-transpeptidase YbiS
MHAGKFIVRIPAGLLVLAVLPIAIGCRSAPNPQGDVPKNERVIARGDLAGLRSQVRLLEARIRRLETSISRSYPGSPVILIDTSKSRIAMMLGTRVIVEGTCSSGNGMELADAAGKRTWTFDTPRGHFRVLGKVADPVWIRPDWSFIEEGEPIPKNYSQRAMANVLGDYAIAFGDGYYIHGTLYTRLLGSNVTHGCIRVDDKVLKKLYQAAQAGTHIWIY